MILMWRHQKYYQELAKKRKQLEREQANERASEQADKQESEQASSAEYDPNRWLRGKVFRGDQAEDRGASYSRIVLQA